MLYFTKSLFYLVQYMNESQQSKPKRWRRHLEQGVASVMIVAASGCAKAPEDELRTATAGAVESCMNPGKDGRGRSKSKAANGIVTISIPCEMTGDKATMEREIANAAKVCSTVQPGDTEIYLGPKYKEKEGIIAACTLAGKNPLMASDAAPPPSPRKRRSIYADAFAPPAEPAASAPDVTAPNAGESRSFKERFEQGAKAAQTER